MRKMLFLMVLAISLPMFGFGQTKTRLAIYITNNNPFNEIISNRLMRDFRAYGNYSPVDRSADFLAALRKEHAFEESGMVDDEQIATLGKQFGVQNVCVVSVLDVWQNEKYISVHIIDVNSAEVVGSCSSSGQVDSPDQLMNVLDVLSIRLTEILENSKLEYAEKIAIYVTRTGNRDLDVVLGDQLVTGFANSGKYIAVERTNSFLKQLQKEVGYQYSGAVDDDEKIAALGKSFGVQFVCVAKTTRWGEKYFISARMINVETALVHKVYNLENVSFLKLNDLVDAAKKIADNLVVMDDKGYIDLQLDLASKSEEEIFVVLEQEPSYPGGEEALYRFLSNNIIYPSSASESGIMGTVIIRFVVEKDGQITNAKIVKDIGGGCGEEALRVVNAMPRWVPGKQRNVPVRAEFNLPINFILY